MAKSRTILIWHNNGEQQFTFTVNPERLRVSRPNCNRVERLAMGGTVNLWGGRGLREVSFTTFLPEERSPFYGGTADARQMVNRCAVIDRRGAAAATAQNTTDLARFGLRQRVLGKSGDAAAQAQGGLRGRILRGELTVRGDLRYRCGAMVELHRKEFGLDGAYPLTAVKHRWERGLFTTELTWEGEA